jgi:hypothetical protein
MALGLQTALNNFQFERTVDWRLSFRNVFDNIAIADSVLGMQLKTQYFNDWVFAQSGNFGVGSTQLSDDEEVSNYASSHLIYPNVSAVLYTDSNMWLEDALAIWVTSARLPDGRMPVNLKKEDMIDLKTKYGRPIINPVQTIAVQRINPINTTKALTGLLYDIPFVDAKRNDINESDILYRYEYDVYLLGEDSYSATNTTQGLRTVRLNWKVVGFRKIKDQGKLN